MPRLLATAFSAANGSTPSSALDALATLQAEGWQPPAGTVHFGVARPIWHGALTPAQDSAGPIDQVLLLATAMQAAALAAVATAINAADRGLADAVGQRWAGSQIAPGGRGRLATTLPAKGLAQAITSASGAAAHVAEDAGTGTVNRALYGLLAQRQALAVGLVLVPLPVETARVWGRPALTSLNRADVLEAVRAALAHAAAIHVTGSAATGRN
jgi:pyrrolidone-carboxylate peptidase